MPNKHWGYTSNLLVLRKRKTSYDKSINSNTKRYELVSECFEPAWA